MTEVKTLSQPLKAAKDNGACLQQLLRAKQQSPDLQVIMSENQRLVDEGDQAHLDTQADGSR